MITKELSNVTGVGTPVSAGSTQIAGANLVIGIADRIRNIGTTKEPNGNPRLSELGYEDTTSGGSEGGSIRSIIGISNATARVIVVFVIA